jgi:hypothetical protein
MSEFEDIQRLLRLKRHERPPEDFVEDFVRQFQHRQRQELLRHSARGLLWERVSTYFEGIFAPSWRWAGATAVALLAVIMVFKPAGTKDPGFAGSDPRDVRHAEPISGAEVERYLISRHFDGGLGTEHQLQRSMPVNGDFQVRPLTPPSLRQDAEMK